MTGGREKNARVYERKLEREEGEEQKQGETGMYGGKHGMRVIMRAEVKE